MMCSLCQSATTNSIYRAGNTPIFQNKVYPTREQALLSPRGPVELFACPRCDFVCNGRFDATLMHYDGEYQNEQAHSPTFDRYLDDIIDLLQDRGFAHKKIIEVGCGKGTFLQKLWARGFEALGFDTAYEGNDARIHKEYFSEKYADLQPDLIILRHTLEHISEPLQFLQHLSTLTPQHTKIYIEVPSFEWIMGKQAFWDVFFEHCNYFTVQSLTAMFDRVDCGLLFGDQYMYAVADLHSVRSSAVPAPDSLKMNLLALQDELERYRHFVQQHPGLLLWGAGAKGSTFANLTDPNAEYIRGVVDINAKKSGAFLAGSGHPIISPAAICNSGAQEILVMNENYREEIANALAAMGLTNIRLYTLGL